MPDTQSALNTVDASAPRRPSRQPEEESQTNRRYPKVVLREASRIVTGPVPPDFLFLESPSPPPILPSLLSTSCVSRQQQCAPESACMGWTWWGHTLRTRAYRLRHHCK
ncbi:hypothetical protein G7Y89_g15347 [Cudoniella acicularis]|uniref:Uncharacterized protein n=1 Tax=Cudoniella acicularis TaxID=354080 RepID=A0A8H4QP99_9HELO|nr:hypothetical protein G7Y89_g15347 [Cudoniella acicularis]